jgi:hypothetical protein
MSLGRLCDRHHFHCVWLTTMCLYLLHYHPSVSDPHSKWDVSTYYFRVLCGNAVLLRFSKGVLTYLPLLCFLCFRLVFGAGVW